MVRFSILAFFFSATLTAFWNFLSPYLYTILFCGAAFPCLAVLVTFSHENRFKVLMLDPALEKKVPVVGKNL
jgi:hypothetical protein